jgi:hypothetical protein
MLTRTFFFLEPYVAATRPARLGLVRRFLLALDRALRSADEREGACHIAGTVFGMPSSVLSAVATQGPEKIDEFLERALSDRLAAISGGLDAGADWLLRWGSLVEALVPDGPHGASPVPDMVTLAPDLAALFARLPELARSSLPMLIEGRAGTGRESLARAVHAGHRAPRPFLTLDALQLEGADAARVLLGSPLAPGLVTQAAEGTVFVRNAESLPAAVQQRLARSLELGVLVDADGRAQASLRCRFIFAVGDGALAAAGPGLGTLQPDFAARASVLFARLPPLAERGEDLAALYRNVVRRFVLRREQPLSADEVSREPRMSLTPRALLALYAYPWPGDVAEFVSVVREARQRAASGPVELAHLPERVVAALGRGGDAPDDRLRSLLVQIAPAAVAGPAQVDEARRQLREFRDARIAHVLGPDATELLARSLAAFNALRPGQYDPLPLERVLAQVQAAAAREVLLPTGSLVPLFWDERVEMVSELEALAAAQGLPGALARRLFDLGRALVLFPAQALAQLRPSDDGGQQGPSALALALLSAVG